MNLPSFPAFFQRIAAVYSELTHLADAVQRLDSTVARHEADIADLRERVARLEEARQTLRAEVESELLKAVRQIEKNTEAQLNEIRRTLTRQPALPPPSQKPQRRR